MSITGIQSLTQPRLNPWLRATTLASLVLVPLGSFLQLVVGSRFVFFFAPQYKHAGWWVFVCLLPVFAVLTLTEERFTSQFRARYPTRWVRWFFLYPVTVVFMAGMVVAAPLGWLAVACWAFGDERAPVPARVVFVEEYRSRKGCDQHATLNILSTETTVCLADHYAGIPFKANQVVTVSGQTVSFGFFIGQISTR